MMKQRFLVATTSIVVALIGPAACIEVIKEQPSPEVRALQWIDNSCTALARTGRDTLSLMLKPPAIDGSNSVADREVLVRWFGQIAQRADTIPNKLTAVGSAPRPSDSQTAAMLTQVAEAMRQPADKAWDTAMSFPTDSESALLSAASLQVQNVEYGVETAASILKSQTISAELASDTSANSSCQDLLNGNFFGTN